jgi:hypothetical protein
VHTDDDVTQMIVKSAILCLVGGTMAWGLSTGDWTHFVVFAPFTIALSPGYTSLLTRWWKSHEPSCNCSTCHMRFWTYHLQPLVLLLPLGLISIFLFCFVRQDYAGAITYTTLCAATMLVYSTICVSAFYFFCKFRPQ